MFYKRRVRVFGNGVLPNLCPKGVQKADGINLEQRMHSTRLRLQVLEDVLGEELHDID